MLLITACPTSLFYLRARSDGGSNEKRKFAAWAAMILGVAYFLAPLIATFEFSLRMRRGEYSFDAIGRARSATSGLVLLFDSAAFVTIIVGSSSSCRRLTGCNSACRSCAAGRVSSPAALVFRDRAGVRLHQTLRSSSILPLTATSLGATPC